MRTFIAGTAFAAAAPVLAACGGGGGSSSTSSPTDPVSPGLQWPVADHNTLAARAGGSPLNISGSQVESALQRTVRSDNTLQIDMHDLDYFSGRITSSCRGSRCNIPGLGQVSLNDLFQDSPGARTIEDYLTVMTHNGVKVGQLRGSATFADYPDAFADYIGLGGWLEYGGFYMAATAAYEGPRAEGYLVAILEHASVGQASGSRPISGSATWRGSMTGADTQFLVPVVGTATVRVDFGDRDLDVALTRIVDTYDYVRLPDLHWPDVPIASDGTFQNSAYQTTLRGSFYGPAHQEVGGIFTTSTLVGAFGASRQRLGG